jgi:hypothetical protein
MDEGRRVIETGKDGEVMMENQAEYSRAIDILPKEVPVSEKERGELYFAAMREIKRTEKSVTMDLLKLGEMILYIRKEKLWKYCGSNPETFDEWGTRELGYKKSTLYGLTGVAEIIGPVLLEKPELQEIDFTRLTLLLPILREEDDPEKRLEWLHTAKECASCDDLKNQIREETGSKPPKDGCDHVRRELYEKCLSCDKFIKITDEEAYIANRVKEGNAVKSYKMRNND